MGVCASMWVCVVGGGEGAWKPFHGDRKMNLSIEEEHSSAHDVRDVITLLRWYSSVSCCLTANISDAKVPDCRCWALCLLGFFWFSPAHSKQPVLFL